MKLKLLVLVLIFLACSQVHGQKPVGNVVVKGTVTDIYEVPVAGAIILTDRYYTGVVTNRKGRFSINVSPDVRTIGAFTYNLGSAEVEFRGERDVSLVLDSLYVIKDYLPQLPPDDKKINIGYGTVSRKDMEKNMGYIDATDPKYSSYTNIYDMIQGSVPGVQVSGNKIVIRGLNSINSGTDPLFVVDGLVVSSIDNISPQQVEEIVVLKGSDAAIYGSRAAGGVILITLKGSGK